MIIFDDCSEDQRDLNSHEQYFLLDTLHLLVGENAEGRRAALPGGGPSSLLATGGLRVLLCHEVRQQDHQNYISHQL